MSTNHEFSFGARLKNANDLNSYISGFKDYAPPRAEETHEQIKTLVVNIEQLNKDVAAKKSAYKTGVALRQQLFKGSSVSVEKLLSPVAKAVGAQYGKDSDEDRQVRGIIRGMRATKLEKPPAGNEENGEASETISRSQRSFGSMAQFFKDLVTTIGKINGYATSNGSITIEKLTALSENLNESNDAVANAYAQMKEALKQRSVAYADLSERVKRVKLYVASQYGNSSSEYKMISRLRV